MKTASLATMFLLALALNVAPVAMAQDAPAVDTEAPAAGTESPAADAEAPAADAPAADAPAAQAPAAEEAPAEEPAAEFTMPDLPIIGKPVPGGINYQPAATSIAEDAHWLSFWVHSVMLVIVLFVTGLIAYIAVRFNAKSNPNPARFTHNTKIEIAWTLVPVLILIFIGSFSLPILFKQLEIPDPDVTIKATGNQWYWSYEYADNEFSFDSLMLLPEELAENGYSDDLYRLATDTAVVVPVGAVVKMQMTGADVIHSWTIPAFGVKMDAVPGRLNETWFQVDEPGVYFGQCSELCGKDHAYMPITVKALEPDEYAAWLDWAIDEYGGTRGEEDVAQAN